MAKKTMYFFNDLGLTQGLVANGSIGTPGQALFSNGDIAYWDTVTATSIVAAGANTQLQFNDSGVFGATANLTFDKVTNYFYVNGRIGVGTASPGYALHVAGSAYASSSLFVGSDAVRISTDGSGELGIGYGQTATNQRFAVYNNTTAAFVVKPNGNVGAGTTSPYNARLHVAGNTTSPDLSSAVVSNASAVLGNSDPEYGTYFATYGGGGGAIQQRRGGSAVYYDLYLQPHGGNVGVGTTSPLSKLHVAGEIRHTSSLRSQGATYSSVWMQFDEHQFGNSLILGAGGMTAIGAGESAGVIKTNIAADLETLFLSSDNGGTAEAFRFVSNTQSGVWADRVEAMTILGGGNVGIGTITPGYKLDVNGDARFGGGTPGLSGRINAVSSGGTYISATFTTPSPNITTFMGSDSSNYGMVGTFSAHDFVIRSNNTARATFPSGGGGMTLSGGRPIQISTTDGAIYTTANGGGWSMGTYYKGSSGTIRAGFGAFGADDSLTYAWIGTAHTNAWMTFLGSGNVGIGTTNPTHKLHLYEGGSSDVVFRLTAGNGTYDPLIQFTGQGNDINAEGFEIWYDNDVGDVHLSTTYPNDAATIHFHTRTGGSKSTANERLTLLGNGNVGIGTANPSTRLHIVTGNSAEGEVRIENSSVAHSSGINFYTAAAGQRGFVGWRGTSSTAPFNVSGMHLINFDNTNLILGTTNTERFRIDASGNTSIGTTSTTHKLRVEGTTRTEGLLRTNSRITNSERYPVGHYTPGETVFEIDPTWTQAELQEYFASNSVTWVADSTAPGGYAISIVGNVNVGGFNDSGFPYIPVDQDDIFYMECWIRNVSGTNTHYMGSQDFDHNLSSLGGNPGSFGYWVMSNTNPGTSWVKVSAYISGFGTATGQFASGTKYWTPQALFNYTGGGTCYISGWKVIKTRMQGNRTFSTITAERYRGVNSLTLNSYQTINPGSNVFLYSQPNDRDAWLFLDSADTGSNWGIYHRQIDSSVLNLPANSIGFVGGGASALQAYISLANGNAFFNGNVGIGTTTPATKLNILIGDGGSNGTAGLRIGGTSNYESLELGIVGAYGAMFRSYGNDMHYYSGHWRTVGTGASEDHSHFWYTSKSGSANWSTAKMTFNHDGNLGIGTTSPQKKLDVIGGGIVASFGSAFGATGFAGIHFGYSESASGSDLYKKSALVFERTDNHGWGQNASGKIHFLLNNSSSTSVSALTDSVMTIDSDASGTVGSVKVGIGTRNPGYQLDVIGTIRATSFSNDATGSLRVFAPGGASYATSSSTITGAIKVTLPVTWTDTMLRFTVKIYEYATNESFEVNCGGYNYSAGYWVHTFAYIIGNPNTNRNFTVRFGHDGSKCCVYIGETGSTWSYPQVTVTDFQAGYNAYSTSTWDDGWDISFATSFGALSGDTQAQTQIGRYTYAHDINGGNLAINSNWGGTYTEQLVIRGTYPSWTVRSSQSDTGWLFHTDINGNWTLYSIAEAYTTNNNNWTQRFTFRSDGTIRNGGPGGHVYFHQGNLTNVSQLSNDAAYITATALTPYLPLAGGTMSGQLNIGTSTNLSFGSQTRQMINLWSTSYGIGIQSNTQYYRSGGRFSWFIGGSHSDSENNAGSGGVVAMTLDSSNNLTVTNHITGNYIFGSYFNSSAGNSENPTIGQIWTQSTGDNYLRKSTPAHFISQLSLVTNTSGGISIGNNTAAEVDVYYQSSSGYWQVGVNNYYGTSSFFFYRDASSYRAGLDASANFFVEGSVRAPVFYDRSSTSYYFNPTGTTSLRTVGSWRSDSSTWDGEFNGKIQYHSSYWYFQALNGWYFRNSGGSNVTTINSAGDFGTSGIIRSGSNFYADQNYGYGLVGLYASTRFQGVFAMGDSYKLSADGTSVGSLYGIAWSYPSAGGPAANLASHGMLILENGGFRGAWGGGRLVTTSDIRGTIFYDYDNTGYYCDPNGESYLYRLRVGPYTGHVSSGNVTGLELRNTGGTGDGDVAAMSFHCANYYGSHLHLRHDGYFGAGGWSASSWRWYVNLGNGDMTAAGNVTAYSDPRLKEEITPITSPIERLSRLNGVRFKWKESSVIGHPGKYDYGVLANEVEQEFPELVHDSIFDSGEGDRFKTVAYDKLIPVLIEAVKEQTDIINSLKKELQELKQEIAFMKKRSE